MIEPTSPIGESPEWLEALEQASGVAELDRPILIIGERGTGKELIGERLHFLSRRWNGPFVKVNCAALNEELLDSELFGHEVGAFTGATKRRIGRFEQADGGTIFLDEIATASQRVQEKLLRVIEYGEFQRLGGEDVLNCDVRVSAATNIDLPGAVADGKFRADLLDRLAFDVVTLPPLRVRHEDISLLADHFGAGMARELGAGFPGFSASAILALEAHDWPGNVRELENAMHRAVLLSVGDIIDADAIRSPDGLEPVANSSHPTPTGNPVVDAATQSASVLNANLVGRTVADVEQDLILDTLSHCLGNRTHAANILGIAIRTLRNKLKAYSEAGVDVPQPGEVREAI